MRKIAVGSEIALFILENYQTMPLKEMEKHIDAGRTAILTFMNGNPELFPPEKRIKRGGYNKKKLTEEVKRYIESNIREKSYRKMSKELKVGKNKMLSWIKEMNIEGLSEICKEKKEKHQFKRGDVPHNKLPEQLSLALNTIRKIQKQLLK